MAIEDPVAKLLEEDITAKINKIQQERAGLDGTRDGLSTQPFDPATRFRGRGRERSEIAGRTSKRLGKDVTEVEIGGSRFAVAGDEIVGFFRGNDFSTFHSGLNIGTEEQKALAEREFAKAKREQEHIDRVNRAKSQKRIEEINREEKELFLKRERQQRLAGLIEQEQQFRGELISGTESAQSAVDKLLGEQLGETGAQADQAFRQVGGAFAERGLSRSSFAQEAVEDVAEAEFAQRSELRAGAERQKSALEQRKERTLEKLSQSDQARRADIRAAQEKGMLDEALRKEQQRIEQFFSEQITQAQIDAQEAQQQGAALGIIGKAVGAIGVKFLTGGLG